jgi:thiosulfate dehydrogenase [quinone] large subunit
MTEATRSWNQPLAALQIMLGYEWLVSGLTKVVRGDFAAGLAHDLASRDQAAAGWYRQFIGRVIVPHAHLFGVLIEAAEFTIGLVLIATGLVVLLHRFIGCSHVRLLRTVAGTAAFAGFLLTMNFALANGDSLPLPVASSSFDEGVSLDTLMTLLQAALVVSLAGMLVRDRRRIA